jgi:hypothetical protein
LGSYLNIAIGFLKTVPKEFWVVGLLVTVWVWRGCERDSYWEEKLSRADTTTTIITITPPDTTYRRQFLDSTNAEHRAEQSKLLARIAASTLKYAGAMEQMRAHIDTLEQEVLKYTQIKTLHLQEANLGDLWVHYDPITEYVDFVHTPPPQKIERVVITQPAQIVTDETQIVVFTILGAAVGAIIAVIACNN